MKYLLLLLPLCALAVEWDTQTAAPHIAVVHEIDRDYTYAFGDSVRTRAVGIGIVIVPPDTLRQVAAYNEDIQYVLYPWLSVGDTLRYWLNASVHKQCDEWVVPREAWISKTK